MTNLNVSETRVTNLDKIYHYYNNKKAIENLSFNVLFTTNGVRYISSQKDLANYFKYDNCHYITHNYKCVGRTRRMRSFRINFTDESIEKVIPICKDTVFYGYFSYKVFKKYEHLSLYPIKMTPDLEDNMEYVIRKTLLNKMELTNYPFKQETINVILNTLLDCSNKRLISIQNTAQKYKLLLLNEHVNPQQIINFLLSHESLRSVDISEYVLKNPKYNLLKFVKNTDLTIEEITRTLDSPALTDEIFLILIKRENYKYVNTSRVINIYKTLSLEILLNNFKYLNPILMYKYKKYNVGDQEEYSIWANSSNYKNNVVRYSEYVTWYRFPEFRDDFINTLTAIQDKDFMQLDNKYLRYLIHCVHLTEEIFLRLRSISYWYPFHKIYKNPTFNTNLVHMSYKINYNLIPWYLSKYIPINDICELLYQYKDLTNLKYIYRRVDLPFNVLLYLTNGKLSRKACKNIYITKDLIAEYNIKPSFTSLRENMFHLDPRYIKQPSYSIEI